MLVSEAITLTRWNVGDPAQAGQRASDTSYAGWLGESVVQLARDLPAVFMDGHGRPQLPLAVILQTGDDLPAPPGYEYACCDWAASRYFASDSHDARDAGNAAAFLGRYRAAVFGEGSK